MRAAFPIIVVQIQTVWQPSAIPVDPAMHAVNAGSLGAGNATKTLIFEHPKNAGFAREDAAQSALKRRK